MKQNFKELFDMLDKEQMRVKTWINENGFHSGTSVGLMASKYRKELKSYMGLLLEEIRDGDFESYREIEDCFNTVNMIK